TPSPGFLPMMGFSLYLQIGAPLSTYGLSCHGTFFTAGLIIFTSLIFILLYIFPNHYLLSATASTGHPQNRAFSALR
ncbi:MAG: hypothetical protein K2O15_08730, partial [Lachnospiraceae bacterium]|nr:hypothetical protein [Lachnospiraceae bacterium]